MTLLNLKVHKRRAKKRESRKSGRRRVTMTVAGRDLKQGNTYRKIFSTFFEVGGERNLNWEEEMGEGKHGIKQGDRVT